MPGPRSLTPLSCREVLLISMSLMLDFSIYLQCFYFSYPPSTFFSSLFFSPPFPPFPFPPSGLWLVNNERNVKNSLVKITSGMHLVHILHVSPWHGSLSLLLKAEAGPQPARPLGDCREIVSCCLILMMRMD